MSGPEEWRTQSFRQSVIARIDEAIRQYGMNTSRNSIEMENHVYMKAKTREEYLGFVARLILHVREMNSKKTGMQAGQPQAGGMPDPINALQNLASQGNFLFYYVHCDFISFSSIQRNQEQPDVKYGTSTTNGGKCISSLR